MRQETKNINCTSIPSYSKIAKGPSDPNRTEVLKDVTNTGMDIYYWNSLI